MIEPEPDNPRPLHGTVSDGRLLVYADKGFGCWLSIDESAVVEVER